MSENRLADEGVSEDLNPYHTARGQFDCATYYLPDLQTGFIEFFVRPRRITTLEFSVLTRTEQAASRMGQGFGIRGRF